jgi:hypothetical protein
LRCQKAISWSPAIFDQREAAVGGYSSRFCAAPQHSSLLCGLVRVVESRHNRTLAPCGGD